MFEKYAGKKILVTGHTGFKGSWLVSTLDLFGAEVFGFSDVVLPNSHYELLNPKIDQCIGDIRDLAMLRSYVEKVKPDLVFHLAAQALVYDSFVDPVKTYSTNVIGTLNVFESVRHSSSPCPVISITTDKVYKNNEWPWSYREIDTLGGKDIYSSSKSCVEIMTASYRETYLSSDKGFPIVSARAGNVIGGGDWSEKRIVPDIVRSLLGKTELSLRSPESVRPWQHVLESINGYMLLGKHLFEGLPVSNEYNFGPSNSDSLSVGEFVKIFGEIWGHPIRIGSTDQKFQESRLLKIDSTRAIEELGWQRKLSLSDSIEYTCEWYKASSVKKDAAITKNQIKSYFGLI